MKLKVTNETAGVLVLKSTKGDKKNIKPGKSVSLVKNEVAFFQTSLSVFEKAGWVSVSKSAGKKANDAEPEQVVETQAMDIGNEEIKESEKKTKKRKTRRKAAKRTTRKSRK